MSPPRTLREARLEEAIRLMSVEGFTYRTGCSDPMCRCHIPRRVCSEFMGSTGHCPRCGWHKAAHTSGTSVGEERDCNSRALERDAGSIPAPDTSERALTKKLAWDLGSTADDLEAERATSKQLREAVREIANAWANDSVTVRHISSDRLVNAIQSALGDVSAKGAAQ